MDKNPFDGPAYSFMENFKNENADIFARLNDINKQNQALFSGTQRLIEASNFDFEKFKKNADSIKVLLKPSSDVMRLIDGYNEINLLNSKAFNSYLANIPNLNEILANTNLEVVDEGNARLNETANEEANSSYHELLRNIDEIKTEGLSDESKDFMVKQLETFLSSFESSSEVSGNELDSVDSEKKRKSDDKDDNTHDTNHYFYNYFQKILSPLKNSSWTSEQIATFLFAEFLTIVTNLVFAVSKEQISSIDFFILIRFMLSLFKNQ